MITLFGAAPDSGNEGVTALCHSTISGLFGRGIRQIQIADNGSGVRKECWRNEGGEQEIQRVGYVNGRRLYRSEHPYRIGLSHRLGGFLNPCAQALATSKVILDVSGGDSFTDLYGKQRFSTIVSSKRLALNFRTPLILLPQTLGPFHNDDCRRTATHLLRSAQAVWTRDHFSFEALKELLGRDFDESRHHSGQDLAFLLPRRVPTHPLPDLVNSWLCSKKTAHPPPVAGINTSGLLINDERGAQGHFHLKDSHLSALEAIAEQLLARNSDVRIVLVPHVLKPVGHAESDYEASLRLEERLSRLWPDRVTALPPLYDATELKHIISRLDWFCGARMHACVAALSSGVPTLPLAYSDKTQGVFSAFGFENITADLRKLDTGELVEAANHSFDSRVDQTNQLSRQIPEIAKRGEQQMDAIAAAVTNLSALAGTK